MSDEFDVERKSEEEIEAINQQTVIDESNYNVRAIGPSHDAPTHVGQGGDELFRKIVATQDQLEELVNETATVQDWVQREICNNVAIDYLSEQNISDEYYEIKDGFGEYGKITLMGYKTPLGIAIPRLKIYDKDGDVVDIITGPMVLLEIRRRIYAFRQGNAYEEEDFDTSVDFVEDSNDTLIDSEEKSEEIA